MEVGEQRNVGGKKPKAAKKTAGRLISKALRKDTKTETGSPGQEAHHQ